MEIRSTVTIGIVSVRGESIDAIPWEFSHGIRQTCLNPRTVPSGNSFFVFRMNPGNTLPVNPVDGLTCDYPDAVAMDPGTSAMDSNKNKFKLGFPETPYRLRRRPICITDQWSYPQAYNTLTEAQGQC